ncbi:MAG: hypothetical protein AB7G11_02780 [Phycisphaerales bacterium]
MAFGGALGLDCNPSCCDEMAPGTCSECISGLPSELTLTSPYGSTTMEWNPFFSQYWTCHPATVTGTDDGVTTGPVDINIFFTLKCVSGSWQLTCSWIAWGAIFGEFDPCVITEINGHATNKYQAYNVDHTGPPDDPCHHICGEFTCGDTGHSSVGVDCGAPEDDRIINGNTGMIMFLTIPYDDTDCDPLNLEFTMPADYDFGSDFGIFDESGIWNDDIVTITE